MNHLITIGSYDDYQVIGIIVCDHISDRIPSLLVKFFNVKKYDLNYYPQAYKMITGKGWSYEDLEGFEGDRDRLADDFAKWLVKGSGLPTVEYVELSFGWVS